jgi:hypothetical protein
LRSISGRNTIAFSSESARATVRRPRAARQLQIITKGDVEVNCIPGDGRQQCRQRPDSERPVSIRLHIAVMTATSDN